MPVLKKEEYFNRLHEAISFLEDMTDTFNDLERRAKGDGEDWEKKYRELDESWKKLLEVINVTAEELNQ